MSRYHHELKTETEYYQAVERGDKKFEIRLDDRNFKVGERVKLVEVVRGIPTGKELAPVQIMYILRGPIYGIEKGHCIFCW